MSDVVKILENESLNYTAMSSQPMIDAVSKSLEELGANPEAIVFEK